MKKSISLLALFMALTTGGFAFAEEAKGGAKDGAKGSQTAPAGESITGFGKQLGSEHFLSVGIQGGYGLFWFLVGAPAIGANVGVTFLDHIEVAANYSLRPAAFGAYSVGTFHQIYGDILYRTGTGSGFFVGPSLGVLMWTAPATAPAGYSITALSAAAFAWGVKLGYDIKLTNFLSLGVLGSFFSGFFDGQASLKFWF